MFKKRITSEIKSFKSNDLKYIKSYNIDNLKDWKLVISGPENTPYEKLNMNINIKFNDRYPIIPPKIKFDSFVFHPNIYKNGHICLDILSSEWTPAFKITDVILSIISLLDEPNTSSPANVDASKLYRTNRDLYNKKVVECG